MRISILISTYNGERDIRSLLDSIQELETGFREFEVILRDDSSSDATAKIVEREYGWVHLIRGTGGNVGFVKSNNLAFQEASGDIICCVNQDTVLHPRFVVDGLATLLQDPNILGINTNMIMPWVMSLEQFKEKNQQELPAYEYQLTPYGFVRYVEVEKSTNQTNFMSGGGFFIRKSAISCDGFLFDPTIDMYCEDTELSLRLQRFGGKIMYCPKAIIYHNQRPRKATTVRELNKLVRITRNRFSLFARFDSPCVFALKYPAYLLGIIMKMSYLGLPPLKKMSAYVAGAGVAGLFFCLSPYWLLYSLRSKPPAVVTRNFG